MFYLKNKLSQVYVIALTVLRKKIKELVAYWYSSPQSYCLKQNFKYVRWFWCLKQTRCF